MGGFHLFTLASIPVSVNVGYLLTLALWTVPLYARSPSFALILAFCITISLLVHEFGHALVARHFKLGPQIVLHGFGGLTGHERAKRDRDEALIVAAGPLAGVLLGAAAYLTLAYAPPASVGFYRVLSTLVDISIYWTLFNILPIWPMDGGQLFRLGAIKLFKQARGERITHIVSLGAIVLIALLSWRFGYSSPFLMIILALTAFQNWQGLSTSSGGSEPRRDNPFARELIERAEQAYAAGADEDAARLCHQLRAESQVPPHILGRAWALLGITATRRGDFDEALSYLRRAPSTPDAVEALAQCLYQLDMFRELEELAASRSFRGLPDDVREEILRALQEHGTASA